jgi:hypothetical protein
LHIHKTTSTSPADNQIACPSCGALASRAYCAHCGEKILKQEDLSFQHFLKDAFEEISSLDSKLFRTIKYLITKPGFLTLETMAGRRNVYIKPFRLYITIVVLHFVVFSFFHSADIFTMERFPLFRIPVVQNIILDYQARSGLPGEQYSTLLSQKIKDNLNILFYMLVFLLAAILKLIFRSKHRYYVEHLYYLLHLLSFGLIRNIVLLPFLILEWWVPAMLISVTTQFWYTYRSVKAVYYTSPAETVGKVVLVVFSFLLVFIPSVLLSAFLGVLQVLYL